jgi:hypothetical protein
MAHLHERMDNCRGPTALDNPRLELSSSSSHSSSSLARLRERHPGPGNPPCWLPWAARSTRAVLLLLLLLQLQVGAVSAADADSYDAPKAVQGVPELLLCGAGRQVCECDGYKLRGSQEPGDRASTG